MAEPLTRRLGAEFIGTLLLVYVGAGAFVAALTASHGKLTYAPIGFIAVAFAIVVAGVVYAFGSLSGGHFNPAVTLALTVTRRFEPGTAVPYIAVQLIGGIIGALLIIATFGHGAANIHVTGGTTLGPHVNDVQALTAEAIGTYFVMLAVMALAVDKRAPTGWAGLIIGLAVAGEILVIGPLTSGSVNPARTTGPYLMTTIFGSSGAPWGEYFIYWVGPCVGAVVAAISYDLVMRPRRAAVAEGARSPERAADDGPARERQPAGQQAS
jgi:glycerol uptake facilitator protein